MILGIVFGLFTALFQALSYVFMRRSLDDFPESMAFFMNALTGVFIWIPFAMWTNGVWSDVLYVLPFALLSAVLSEAFVFFATARGDTIITGVLFSTYPVFTILLAFLFLNERLFFFIWIALGFVVLGTLIVSSPSRRELVKEKINHWQFHLIAWPLSAAVAVSISDVLGKSVIDKTSAGTFLIALAIAEVPVALIFLKMQGQKYQQLKTFFTHFSKHKYAFLSGLLSTIAVLTFWLSFEILPASIASPLTGVTPFFVVVLSILFLKEKISLKNTVGLIIVVLGILLLSVYGL